MGIKMILLITFIATGFVGIECQNSRIPVNIINNIHEDSLLFKQRLMLKKYAFCNCLLTKYPKDSFLLKDGSIAGYLEKGSYGNRAYEVIDSFVVKRSHVNYASKYKKPLNVMICLDLYEDPELNKIIESLDGELGLLSE